MIVARRSADGSEMLVRVIHAFVDGATSDFTQHAAMVGVRPVSLVRRAVFP